MSATMWRVDIELDRVPMTVKQLNILAEECCYKKRGKKTKKTLQLFFDKEENADFFVSVLKKASEDRS